MAMNPMLDTPELLAAVQTYFSGEKIEALVFILPIGLLSLAFGAWLWIDSAGGFMRGVAIPFLAMGLLMGGVGAVVGYRTPSQMEHFAESLRQPIAVARIALQAESVRMAKVDSAWSVYLVVWGLMGVTGLALRFATVGGFTQGLGIALVFFCGVGLLVDGFAERRTHPYLAALAAALR
ncbi:MAG: hypothetical protein RLZZ591_1157 [Pseudomonadota bacterium]|jgi:hypothetical protein